MSDHDGVEQVITMVWRAQHQKGPGAPSLDAVALIALATSNLLLRFVGTRPALVPRSSFIWLARCSHTTRQGSEASFVAFGSNDANPAGYP